ncbi:pilus assembly protein, partial [candidate division KSB1 bacterium]|nr:pilus assembly protein [candidate division KSB1 bacterium]NIR69537.1 pilus assembly protein [candidate division KSB1 bacterium]NIS24304.1 pilus assembly protein [candidate division KSB1 bacterium]NIT71222.1 pilus assembly protein [candidate division KSB1 bacterium]NIU24926.1 pilus assembly protein [candidate division KSB1 bacterium]
MGTGVDPSKRKAKERGATVVEFAVLAALFLIIVFGLLEFGIIFFQKHYVAGAAREGVRLG